MASIISRLVPGPANARRASGARSWTISSNAVPSSPAPGRSGSISSWAGRSPVAWADERESTPSEITPTVTPAPVNPDKSRTTWARWIRSPSEFTPPVLVIA